MLETTCDLTHSQCKRNEGDVIGPWNETFTAIMTGNELYSSISVSPAKVFKPAFQYNHHGEGSDH